MKNRRSYKHGLSKTNFYRVWAQLKYRCNNKKNHAYSHYGGRGIKVCERWLNFENFYQDMYLSFSKHKDKNKTTSIERTDVDGDYSPENCRWVTMIEQQKNRRHGIFLTFKEKTQSLSEWSKETGIKYLTLYQRLQRGLSSEEIFHLSKEKLILNEIIHNLILGKYGTKNTKELLISLNKIKDMI